MPNVHFSKDYLFKLMGKTYTIKELQDICFQFGIEIEEDKEDNQKFLFEISANRHDLLCVEGLADALASFVGIKQNFASYTLLKSEPTLKMYVKKEIRPYVVCALLRDIAFDEDKYASFIDFQDKLHQNLCRRRTLVAVGTHDFDTIKGPFTYEARPPKNISFIPLNQTETMDGDRLMEFYSTDSKLKEYLPIIRDSPVYPVIYDSNGVVLSLPPIINSDHSKLDAKKTRNIFIESTATDETKAKIVLNLLVTMFSRYCKNPFTVEEVEIIYEDKNLKKITPDFSTHTILTDLQYLSTLAGIKLESKETIELLKKMGLTGQADGNKVSVEVPIIRSDILHACDLAEDIAIAYGYNNIIPILEASATTGAQLFLNKMTDLVRHEIAQAGYNEALNFVLTSMSEMTTMLNKSEISKQIVTIANPKTSDFQCSRITLIPGLLKNLASNKGQKLFEAGDIVLQCDNETGAKNQRRVAALYTDSDSSGLEFIHGLLDHIMSKLQIKRNKTDGYYTQTSQDTTFIVGRQAEVTLKGKVVGIFGILHPKVLKAFAIMTPVSVLEVDLEKIVADM